MRWRSRALGITFIAGILLGSLAPDLNASPTVNPDCGFYPRVALRRDCAKPRGVRFIHHPRLACIAEAEGSGWQSMSASGYYGRWQMSRSAWESVLHPRFDPLRGHAPPWVQALKAKRLLYLRGTQPWPPARHC